MKTIVLESCFYFICFWEQDRPHELLVADAVETHENQRFVRRIDLYFAEHRPCTTGQHGLCRRHSFFLFSFFVSSDMICRVQTSDLAGCCLNARCDCRPEE